jgi:pilus assembly protein CpaF
MNRLFDLVLDHTDLAELDPAERRLALRNLVRTDLDGVPGPMVRELTASIDGCGPLAPLMADPCVTDILINGPGEVWIDSGEGLARTSLRIDPLELAALVERAVGDRGGRVDVSSPIADTWMKDGSRMHVVLPPIAPEGPIVSIRRFPATAYSLVDLVGREMLDADEAERLTTAIQQRRSVLISGATGTGKTTLLGALLACVPASERIVTIEEVRELFRGPGHVVSLVTRAPNVEGTGAVDARTLVRAALRMRPDRIVVGEVRGAEAFDALSAMSTGHEGSLVTVHARSAAGALDRIASLALEADTGMSLEVIRLRVEAAFDLVVHLERRGRTRCVAEVLEV